MKKITVKDLKGHFYLSIKGKEVMVSYNNEHDVSLSIAFSQAMKNDKDLFNIISEAILILIESEKKPVKTKKLKNKL
jgi:hypothetical protein